MLVPRDVGSGWLMLWWKTMTIGAARPHAPSACSLTRAASRPLHGRLEWNKICRWRRAREPGRKKVDELCAHVAG